MPDDRPQYDDFKRPSPVTCVVGVIIALLIWAAVLAIVFVGFPDLRAALTYPLLAIAVLIVAGGGIYYLATNRRRKAEHTAQSQQRAASDDWVAKELAESPYQSADETPEDPNGT